MNVLIIDNDASIRKALKIGLTRAGWVINDVPAEPLRVAALWDRFSYDIVVVDLDIDEKAILDGIRKEKQQNQKMIVVGVTRKSVSDCLANADTPFINSCYQIPLHLNMLKKAIDLELNKR